MDSLKKLEIWFLTGSQHLYGQETLNKVAENAQHIVHYLKNNLPIQLIFKPVLKSSEEIYQLILDANYTTDCIGIITWMHTFSPSKMWINGLKILQKPLCHLHTQFNRDIPWNDIDMDFYIDYTQKNGGNTVINDISESIDKNIRDDVNIRDDENIRDDVND